MNLETIREFCLNKLGKITEDFPFDEEVLVFRVYGRIFLLTNVTKYPLWINLKCDPGLAVELRERYEAVQPGYHMNKKRWNTVTCDGSIPRREIFRMIDHSYDEVVKGLKNSFRSKLLKLSKEKS